mgnify:CR=1 FL=1
MQANKFVLIVLQHTAERVDCSFPYFCLQRDFVTRSSGGWL